MMKMKKPNSFINMFPCDDDTDDDDDETYVSTKLYQNLKVEMKIEKNSNSNNPKY